MLWLAISVVDELTADFSGLDINLNDPLPSSIGWGMELLVLIGSATIEAIPDEVVVVITVVRDGEPGIETIGDRLVDSVV